MNKLSNIDESLVRSVALVVFVLGMIGLLFSQAWIFAFLALDFCIRGFLNARYSLLILIGKQLKQYLPFPSKPVYLPPKRFAARIGFFLSMLIVTSFYTSYLYIGYAFAMILCIFSFLECVFAFCAGCYVYDFGIRLFNKQQK